MDSWWIMLTAALALTAGFLLLKLLFLRRVFDNILSNAAKYTDGDLSVRLTPDGRVTISNRVQGLDRVQAGRLFDRFFTVEAANGSTGLGLSIAKLLTEKWAAASGRPMKMRPCRSLWTFRSDRASRRKRYRFRRFFLLYKKLYKFKEKD